MNLATLMQKNIAVQDLKIRYRTWDPDVYFAVRGKNEKGVWGHYSHGVPGGISYRDADCMNEGWSVWSAEPPKLVQKSPPGLYVARENMHMDFTVEDFDGKLGIPKGSVFYLEEANPKFWAPLLEPYASHDGTQYRAFRVVPQK